MGSNDSDVDAEDSGIIGSGAASSLASETMLSSVSDLLIAWKSDGAATSGASSGGVVLSIAGMGGAMVTEASASLPENWLETALTVAFAADWVEEDMTWRSGRERRLRE